MRGEGKKEGRRIGGGWWLVVGGGVAERITSEQTGRKVGRRKMVCEPRNVDLFRTWHAV